MAMVHGYSFLVTVIQAGQWLNSVGLAQGSVAIWRCSAFIA